MSSYEEYILKILLKEHINFQREKTFRDLHGGSYRFDFYCDNINGAPAIIEVHGEYHFNPIRGQAAFQKGLEHDRRKTSYCLANNIPLYIIPYWELPTIETSGDIFTEQHKARSMWHTDKLIEPKK